MDATPTIVAHTGEMATTATQMYAAYITMNGLNGPPVMSSNPVSSIASAASATPSSTDGTR